MDEGILPKKREEIDAFNRRMATYWDRASLCPCENCGRTFSREALERHRVLCTPDNPMKSVPGSNKPPQTTTAQPADEKSKSTLSASSGPASPSSPLDR